MSSKLFGCIWVLLKAVLVGLIGRLDRLRGRFVMIFMSGRRTRVGKFSEPVVRAGKLVLAGKLGEPGEFRVACEIRLARPATRPLPRDDRAVVEDLATPD